MKLEDKIHKMKALNNKYGAYGDYSREIYTSGISAGEMQNDLIVELIEDLYKEIKILKTKLGDGE